MDFKECQEISISIGGAIAQTAVYSRMFHGRITAITDKAIQLQGYEMESRTMKLSKYTCWIPKKALLKPEPIPGIGEVSYYKLAKWFKAEKYTEWFLTNYAHVSGSTAQ